jgi:hypothetical protein
MLHQEIDESALSRRPPIAAVPAPIRPLVRVYCEGCGRDADVEDGPGVGECIFCSHRHVRIARLPQ